MIGLLVLFALGLYFLVSFFVVRAAVRSARDRGKNHWLWGGVAAFAMYNLIFWDWVPTIVAHRYYCAKEAGFWVYKSVDQWKAENPRVIEDLVENDVWNEKMYWSEKHKKNIKISEVNNRFGVFSLNHLNDKNENELFMHVWRWEVELIDLEKNEIVARKVDFSTGDGFLGGDRMHLKFQSSSCFYDHEYASKYNETIKQFKGVAQ